MDPPQRVGEGGGAGAGEKGRVLPFRQGRKPAQRGLDRALDLVRRQPFGQGIDRLDQRKAGKLRFRHDAVRVDHLQHAVIERDRAGHIAPRADGQELIDVVFARVEIGDHEVAGPVACIDQVRRARTPRRRRTMALDLHGDRDDGARHDVAQLRPRAAVDRTSRQMEEKVEHARPVIAAEQTRIQLLKLRTDAGQGRQRGEQGVEQGRAHRWSRCCLLAPSDPGNSRK